MRHPLHPAFRVPRAFVELREYLIRGFDPDQGDLLDLAWERSETFFSGEIDALLLDADAKGEPHPELCYLNQPIEIVPFAHNGGDGLHYGWAALAPELDPDDHVCVSFAPVDDHACWLGDTTHQALENLLAGRLVRSPAKQDDPRWQELCTALGLRPPVGTPDITAGARSPRSIAPVVPAGWRYAPCSDRVGVLAPEDAFAPGGPAAAIEVLKSKYPDRTVMASLRDAYRDLGRDLHVERAEIWLARQ